ERIDDQDQQRIEERPQQTGKRTPVTPRHVSPRHLHHQRKMTRQREVGRNRVRQPIGGCRHGRCVFHATRLRLQGCTFPPGWRPPGTGSSRVLAPEALQVRSLYVVPTTTVKLCRKWKSRRWSAYHSSSGSHNRASAAKSSG